jgi:hypothetical protein
MSEIRFAYLYFIYGDTTPRGLAGKRHVITVAYEDIDGAVSCGFSTTAVADQFCKKTGRTKAEGHLDRYNHRRGMANDGRHIGMHFTYDPDGDTHVVDEIYQRLTDWIVALRSYNTTQERLQSEVGVPAFLPQNMIRYFRTGRFYTARQLRDTQE